MALQTPAVIRRSSFMRAAGGLVLGALGLGLAACSHGVDPIGDLFSSGNDGGGGSERQQRDADLAASNVTAIGVNSYLWRASLETLSFMPLTQADSSGGVIVTDWYANPQNPSERVKISVSILDQDLRADALRVVASREVLQGGTWVTAPVQAATVQRLEDIILTKARDLRRSAVG
jgi:hypothetical protein